MKMNPEIKKQWVEALRSGKYKQAREQLKKRSGAMCCLGVLEHKVLGVEYEWDKVFMAYTPARDDHEHFPSKETLEKANLTLDIATLLAEMNDDEELSFNQIADYIEENL